MTLQNKIRIVSVAILTFILIFSRAMLFAQPEEITINYSKTQKSNRLAPVTFPHELHIENYECLDCHHKYENGENVLEEDELEEGNPAANCTGCHNLKKNCDLQKTFHRQCLSCHVNKQTSFETHAPRMCTGCHKKVKLKDKPNTE